MCAQSHPTLCDPMDCSHQAPLSTEFSRQEGFFHWRGLPFPTKEDLSNPGIKSTCPTLAGLYFYHCTTWEAHLWDSLDGSPPGSPIPGILQARTLEWVAISFSNAWKWKAKVKSLSCVRLNLADPMDFSLPGSSAHGIFQARVLEWGAIALSNSKK